MANEVEKQLAEYQTGEYIPTENEAELLKQIEATRASRPNDGVPRPGPLFNTMRISPYGNMRQENISDEAAAAGWGQSRFDRAQFEVGEDLENTRANEQSGFNKILNGALKGGVYAVTTFVETTAGLLNNIVATAGAIGEDLVNGGNFSLSEDIGKGVNSWVPRTMANIQKLSDEWFPNYRTAEERSAEYQNQWFRHILTPNFIGDSLLKNFGFTVGAMYGGALWSKALNAGMRALSASNMLKGVTAAASGSKESAEILGNVAKAVGDVSKVQTVEDANAIAKMFKKAARGLNKMTTKHELYGGVISALGEGTMEGVMARNEFVDGWEDKLKQEYVDSYMGLEQNLADELKDTEYTRAIPVIDENGNTTKKYELNDDGKDVLRKRQQELAADYAKKRQWVNELGDRVAATTMLWNLPILTVSNTMQFGRMLSGGYKTTRSNIARVAGKLTTEAGDAAADYGMRTGNKVARIAAKSAKNGLSEAAEEMAQGFVSSGSKKVADTRMTSFNDNGYDRAVLNDLGAWYQQMMEGGGEYLSDWTNWQEGFMGLLTGLVGIPSRKRKNWNGGIIGAINEVNEENRMSKDAADKLNERVNSQAFKDAWKGYVRHNKYETDMKDAIVKDDQYAWATANDLQLINDVMMFANAGRMEDLKDLVDYYANLSDEEAEAKGIPEQVTSKGNEKEVQNNQSAAISKVREQAKNIKDTIQLYSDMFDDMTTLAPIGTSDDQIQEMIATSMNIKALEKRFLTMFDDVLGGLGDYVSPLAYMDKEGEEITDDNKAKERAKEIYSNLAQIITNTGNGINYDTVQDYMDSVFTMQLLDDMVKASKDEVLKKKFSDMKKVADDRRDFMRKLVTLRDLKPGEYDKQKETPEKASAKVQKQNAEKALAGTTSFKDIRAKYLSLDDKERENYIATIAPKAKEDKNVKEFLEFKQKFDGFKDYINKHVPAFKKPTDTSVGVDTTMMNMIVDELFERTHSVGDLLSLPASAFRVENQFLEDPNFWQEIPKIGTLRPTAQTYDALKEGIRKAMKDYAALEASTAARNSGSTKPAETTAPAGSTTNTPTGYDPAAPGSNNPAPSKPTAPSTPAEATPAEAQEGGEQTGQASGTSTPTAPATPAKETPTVDTPVKLDRSSDDEAGDAIAAEEKASTDEGDEQVAKEGGRGKDKDAYYRTSVPEISSKEAADARVAIAKHWRDARKNADLSDFLEFIQHQIDTAQSELDAATNRSEQQKAKRSLAFWNGQYEGFKDVWNILNDRGAFEEAALGIRVNDEVEFVIDKSVPEYKGEPQILLRNKRTGRIYSILSRQTSDYYGLQDLRTAIINEYAKKKDSSSEPFVFSKTSRVWAKRDGLIDYAFGENPKDIREIRAYDSVKDSAILYIDRNGVPYIIRGDKKSKIPMSFRNRENNISEARQEMLYMLVDTGTENLVPIGIQTGRLTKDNQSDNNPVINGIRKAVGGIANYMKNAGTNVDAENAGLKAKVKALAETMDIHDVDIKIEQIEGATEPVLSITVGKTKDNEIGEAPTYFTKESATEEALMDYFAGLDRHVRTRVKIIDDSGESGNTNFNDLLENGLIQSNARMLRPKGVDVYIDPWLGEDFGPVTDKQREAHKVAEEVQQKTKPVSQGLSVKPGSGTITGRRRISGRRGAQTGTEQVNQATAGKQLKLSELDENIQSELKKKGYDKEVDGKPLFDKMSREEQDNLLRCITL